MTQNEVEILLKTVYKGEGATKALADMDKISASGSKLSGAMKQVNKALGGDVFGGASESFRKRNPHLFKENQGTAILQSDKFLRMVSNKSLGLGELFPQYKGKIPPIIPPNSGGGFASAFGSRFAGSFGLGRAAAVGGVAGLAGAGAAMALKESINLLKKVVDEFKSAIENARQLYAKSLSSGGLGLQFTARRQALSNILGVSEKDVYQFGQAVLFLSPRIKYATDILAKTAPNLASVSYGFKILELDLQAMFATILNDLAPSIRKTTSFIDELVKSFTSFYTQFKNVFKNLAEIIGNALLSELPMPLRALAQAVVAGVKVTPDVGAAPNPLAFMKQIQASAWERMGLVVGGGGASSPAQETARNTKATAEGVKALVKKASGRAASFGDPFAGAQSYL